MPEPIQIRLTGHAAPLRLPQAFRTTARGGTEDSLLPAGYLVPTASFDLGTAARDVAAGAAELSRPVAPGEVIVLEGVDGGTLVTSAARLREALSLSHPEAIAADGTILLDALRAQGAAPGRGFGKALGGLIGKVHVLVVGAVQDAIVTEALARLTDPIELGVSWRGTRALMSAIENRLDVAPGLYRWVGSGGTASDLAPAGFDDPTTPTPAPAGPMLLFLHGMGSSTLGSFGDLPGADRDLWARLAARYTGGLYGFEHRTLSQGPIENALALALALPQGAQVSLVSHSRGGLVGDLLCLGDFDTLIDRYAVAFEGDGDADTSEAARVRGELATAHAAQREQLHALADALRERGVSVHRYLRVASPASGTLLASGNFDVFLSSVMTLMGALPFFFGNPLYAAFKRVVLEIAKNRTDPHLVPGIEAMLPDSPMARLLRDAPVRPGLAMATIAGDIEGGSMLRRLGVMLTDFLLFEQDDNDLVVNTASMIAGIAPRAAARVLFDRGADVSHFRYFANDNTRTALVEWLTAADPSKLEAFRPLPSPAEFEAALAAATRRDAAAWPVHRHAKARGVPQRPQRRLEVGVRAMDLRFLSQPVMVGHYERDPIAGAEALIDRELLGGGLSERHGLGLYAGRLGSATAVLRVPNERERQRGRLSGAIVTGLGSYDRALSPSALTEAVRTGALHCLLQVVDVLGKADREVPLATLLLGYNSSANLTVAASVEALVRGVMEANATFLAATRLNIQIARLEIVEIYLDTAISAVYALRQLGPQLARQAERHATLLVCRTELEQGEGLRQRLFDDQGASYWPRLIVADAGRTEDEGGRPAALAAAAPPTAAPIADRLRFTYVGQRARAESIALQRQPGLVEQLVAQQIHEPRWNEDFGRMLFQLMVPHDFKESARQLDRVVLVLDVFTANLPWELMLADDPSRRHPERLPLALQTAVVRQLTTWTYRPQVHQGTERRALVIGNPSVAGFVAAFPQVSGLPSQQPPGLAGAEAEGLAIARTLGTLGYTVETAIGENQAAAAVLARLYAQAWRILHVSGHGVFDLVHADGRARSGVLLSDGLLVTAAEIEAMDSVPELVFLNCCHLGQVDTGRGRNKLAASVARELIDIGVRCVVVAGWAVNDASAQRFGECFYEQLLLLGRPFGDAVFEARRAVWRAHPEDITWGAFQAYGEPGWLAEPRLTGTAGVGEGQRVASPEELLDELARRRSDLARRREDFSERDVQAQTEAIEALLAERCPPAWLPLPLPQLQSALGRTWFALGRLERARDCLLAAVQAEDTMSLVPIQDIEKLAEVEARLGEHRAEAAIPMGPRGQVPMREAGELIESALQRLEGLDRLVETRCSATGGPDTSPDREPHAARSAMRGSAWKCKAAIQARRLLQGRLPPAERDAAGREMSACLRSAIAAYAQAEGHPEGRRFHPEQALNRLALSALTDWTSPSDRDAAMALAQQCRRSAAERFAEGGCLRDIVIETQALLVERLIDGGLGRDHESGRTAFEEAADACLGAARHLTAKPWLVVAMAKQLDLLGRLCDAFSMIRSNDAALARSAERLAELAQRLEPGRPGRDDRPRVVGAKRRKR